jgi:hypothetical protein
VVAAFASVGCGEVKTTSIDAGNTDSGGGDPDAPPDAPLFASGSESFESIGDGNLITPFNFASGISLTKPVPNSTDSFGAIIVDCFNGGGFFGFSCADNQHIPNGTAFLGVASLGFSVSELEFTFPGNVDSVSAAISASNSDPADSFIMTAFSANGTMLSSSTANGVALPSWRGNLTTITADNQIRSIRFRSMTNGSIVIDQLRWTVQ